MSYSHCAERLPLPSPTAALGTLRARGLRISTTRRHLVDALFAAEGPVSAEALAALHQGGPRVGLPQPRRARAGRHRAPRARRPRRRPLRAERPPRARLRGVRALRAPRRARPRLADLRARVRAAHRLRAATSRTSRSSAPARSATPDDRPRLPLRARRAPRRVPDRPVRWRAAAVALGIAFLLGLRHATDPDHLMAVTALVAPDGAARARPRASARSGAPATRPRCS